MTTIVIQKLKSPRQESDKSNLQSLDSAKRTSDDLIKHQPSPLFTTSVSNLSNNLINDNTPAFSSFLTNTFTEQESSSRHINSTPENNPATFVSTSLSDINFIRSSPQMDTYSISRDIMNSPQHMEDAATIDHCNANLDPPIASPSQVVIQSPTTPQDTKRKKTPFRYSDASISPHTNTKQAKVTRPSSSSASSATIGLTVTPTSQSRFTNNSDKPPGNESQTSEPSAFVAFQNNNNKNLLMPLENTSRNHSLAISDIQHNMKKMALSEDLEELKRTIDRMQQQRVSDREEHLNRVKEQKLREKEILDQINLTKQRLEMAIAGKFFMEDLNNTNDADNNAISATLVQQQANDFENLQQLNNGLKGPTIEEEYMTKTNPTMKSSTSASSAKSRVRANSVEATKPPPDNRQPENGRSKDLRKQPLNANNRHSNHQGSTSESYFPDANKTDFEYMNQLHGPPPQQFVSPNNLRYGNMRNYHPDMEFMEGRYRYELFDPPRARNARNHPQQPRRQRSKSVESQWLPPQELIDQQHHIQRLQQHDLSYDTLEMSDSNRFFAPDFVRSRKSSTHSARSNPSEGTSNGQDLRNGYHSATEKDDDDDDEDGDSENGTNRHGLPKMNSRLNVDGERLQQFRDDPRNRYRRRPPPSSINGHMPPSMVYHNQAFGPAPHMSQMGMMNDRDRIKMRPPPPYGYNNMHPSGSEYFPYIPQRVSPRMMAAFNEDQQWNTPLPHHSQWGPGSQNIYGIPPPQPENIGNAAAAANGANVVKGNVNVHHLQDTPNESKFGRRYHPAQALQQAPQKSQHGYMGMYPDTPHRLYM